MSPQNPFLAHARKRLIILSLALGAIALGTLGTEQIVHAWNFRGQPVQRAGATLLRKYERTTPAIRPSRSPLAAALNAAMKWRFVFSVDGQEIDLAVPHSLYDSVAPDQRLLVTYRLGRNGRTTILEVTLPTLAKGNLSRSPRGSL